MAKKRKLNWYCCCCRRSRNWSGERERLVERACSVYAHGIENGLEVIDLKFSYPKLSIFPSKFNWPWSLSGYADHHF